MPTYVYRCQRCSEEIEVVQSMSDPPLKRCKVCRGALRRVFHPVGIVLKGSGFYKTDYGSSSGSKSSSRSDDKGTDGKTSDKPKDSSKDTTKDKGSESGSSSGGKDS